MSGEQWLAIGGVVCVILVLIYGVWVGEKDKKEGKKKISNDFGI